MGDHQDISRLVRIAEVTGEQARTADIDAECTTTCVDTLAQLEHASVTVELLRDGKQGKRVRALLDHNHKLIANGAAAVISSWKRRIKALTEDGSKQRLSASPNKKVAAPQATSKASRAEAANGSVKGDIATVEARVQHASNGKDATANLGNEDTSKGGASLQRQGLEEGGNRKRKRRPPFKIPDSVADPARNKLRKAMADALIIAVEDDFEELDSPYMTSAAIEQKVYDACDEAGYRAQVRTILFNLKDKKNPDFRRRVLIGEVNPDEMVTMKSEQMASDKKREENSNIRAYMQRETARTNDATGNITDMFKCGKCKKRRTTYYQMQTRSADEPMTTFVRCLECSHRWKFC